MTLKACVRSGVLVAILVSAAPAMAVNLSFIKDAPYGQFTKEDHRIFNAALDNLLDQGVDGETRAWSNPASDASGEITPVKTFERAGATCRTLAIANKAKGLSGSGKYNFCRQKTGKWALAN
jgi:surface antigen